MDGIDAKAETFADKVKELQAKIAECKTDAQFRKIAKELLADHDYLVMPGHR